MHEQATGNIEAWASQVDQRTKTPPSPSAWSEATARPLDLADTKMTSNGNIGNTCLADDYQ